ncbi:MAG TPA: hypothetical protein VHT70_04285 [Candidatus Saccharimonadales bacterium]|jgi:hypothetical protein|nr:hypothetical protein [Candidatus Saccharimonadales bacterium]
MAQEFYPYDNINPITYADLRAASQDYFHSDIPGENAGVILEQLRDDASRISVSFEETHGIQTVRPVEGNYIDNPLPTGENGEPADYGQIARHTIENLHRAFPLGMVALERSPGSTLSAYEAYVNIGDPEVTLTRAGNLADYMTNAEGKNGLEDMRSPAHHEGLVVLGAASGALTDSEAQQLIIAAEPVDPHPFISREELERAILKDPRGEQVYHKITGEIGRANRAEVLRPDVTPEGMPEGGLQFGGRITVGGSLDYFKFETISLRSLHELASSQAVQDHLASEVLPDILRTFSE